MHPNPSLRIDPALGIVVMEFRDRSGAVAATLPTQRELDAYHAAQRRGRREHSGAQAAPGPAATPQQAAAQPQRSS